MLEHTDHCFVFELTGSANQVVVLYDKPELRLLAVRCRVSGQELAPEPIAELYGWRCVQSFPFAGVSSLDLSVSPAKQEGYVLVDERFTRVKVKTEAYVALHRPASGMTAVDAMSIVMAGEIDEVKAYFPKYAALLDNLADKYALLEIMVLTSWDKYKHLAPDRKAFALAIKDLPFKGSPFLLADGKDWQAACAAKPEAALKLAEAMHLYYS